MCLLSSKMESFHAGEEVKLATPLNFVLSKTDQTDDRKLVHHTIIGVLMVFVCSATPQPFVDLRAPYFFFLNQYGRSQHLRMRARPGKVRDRGRGKQAHPTTVI